MFSNHQYNKKRIFLDLFLSIFMFFLGWLFSSYNQLQNDPLNNWGWKINLIFIGFFILILIFLFIFPRKSKKSLLQQNYKLCLLESLCLILIVCLGFIIPGFGGFNNKHILNISHFFGIINSIAIIFLIHGLINVYVFYYNNNKMFFNFSINLLIFSLGMHFINDPYKIEQNILNLFCYVFYLIGCICLFLVIFKIVHNKKNINRRI